MAGVPVIRTLQEGLAGNHISSLLGILNGTSNFILTRMANRGVEFKRALDEARRKGLAEANASLDIDGYDAAQKLSILGSIALGKWVPPTDVHREGIGHIERADLEAARSQFGYVLRPLAIFKNRGDAVEARVHPTFVPEAHPLASVENEFNALLIHSDTAGPVTLAGKGAGERPAASGVISDIISLARAIHRGGDRGAAVPLQPGADRARVAPLSDVETKFYLHFSVVDRPGVLSFISGVLGKNLVSIATMHQRDRSEQGAVPVIMVTHEAREGAVRKALAVIDAATSIAKRKTVAIRIEE
jgi:homoserine dehydrogenase